MLLLLTATLVLQIRIGTGSTTRPDSASGDSSTVSADSTRRPRPVSRRKHRVALTPELVESAFQDQRARGMLHRARAARVQQDSTLESYDAISRQRISVGLGFKRIGRDRLAFRSENAARVRWRRGVGAWIDVLGSRTAIPMAFPGARALESMLETNSIPYYPGREQLLLYLGVDLVTNDENDSFIHPLSNEAEAYYRYAVGDSISYRLPDGTTIKLLEVNVQAREPEWDLIVGSLWFDAATAHLVRAAYRPASPMDVKRFVEEEDPQEFDDVPLAVRPLIFPMVMTLEAFTVEYGLHGGRWWLPRTQTAEGKLQIGFTRASAKIQETFTYAGVNGRDPLPPIVISVADSGRRRHREVKVGIGGDTEAGFDCAQGDTIVRSSLRYGKTLPVSIRVPCDTLALVNSSLLPPSIFDSGEAMFGEREREELASELSLSLQPGWSPQAPTLHYGPDRGLLRYNRVEGLSAGVSVEQNFGRGFSGEAMVRLGTADWEPNAELKVRRSDGSRSIGLGFYRRLEVSNDWGAPLGFGSSLSALLFARDEGFYYRTWGAELSGTRDRSEFFSWRAFAERQSEARVETQFSLARAFNDVRFIENIVAETADLVGVAGRLQFSRGSDPHGLRLLADLRGEGAFGNFDYSRGALDVTVSRGLGRRLDGALTGGAGTSAGSVPRQRRWYLGGSHTIRGQRAGTTAGDAYWMARAELGSSFVAARPVLFADLGWAGARADWKHGKPISGAGIGISFMDGMFRFDVAKGIRPVRGIRADLYVEARF